MSLIKLPSLESHNGHLLHVLLAKRRSVRDYTSKPVELAQAARLLWAAQGITDERGFRTAPSAGALYPLQLYLVAGAVTGLEPGIYRYLPQKNSIEKTQQGDQRSDLEVAALGQSWLADAALTVVFAARYERTKEKYGRRGTQYVHIEVGHAAQNAWLAAIDMNLSAAVVGAFDDRRVTDVVGLSSEETPLYLVPVGHAA
jgi:SagB-type dehydrogenase family enzyme